MVTVIRWFVRIILTIIFIDWFSMKWRLDNAKEQGPEGRIIIDIGSGRIYSCAFGCSPEDLHEGDIVRMEIRLVDGVEDKTEETETNNSN